MSLRCLVQVRALSPIKAVAARDSRAKVKICVSHHMHAICLSKGLQESIDIYKQGVEKKRQLEESIEELEGG